MKCYLTLPLELLDDADVDILCEELRRLDVPDMIELVAHEAWTAMREGRRMRSLDIPVDYEFERLSEAVQNDWKCRSREKVAEYQFSLPALAAFFLSFANVIEDVQLRERQTLAWFAAQLEA